MTQPFASIVGEEEFSLAEAFLAFAKAEYPDVDTAAALALLDHLGGAARKHMRGSRTDAARLRSLGDYLSGAGFAGDSDDYYDPRNSFLNDVLERRLGIPITLSVVWIEVGVRAGLELAGIGMPMHFLVGLRDGSAYADPFARGELLSPDDAVLLFGRVTNARVPWDDAFLAPTDGRTIVRRALTNLKAVYGTRGDLRKALWVQDHLLEIPGAPPAERRDRARVLAAMGRQPEAIADLRAFADLVPDEADQVAGEIRRLQAAMN